ncbi:MAG TPA: condensation domain-containing protein, partial [Terriglobales bacterium]|nr:condensation domain-containing protein [Terriglobales bacterium]
MKHVNNIAELADEKQKLVSFLLEEDDFELDNRISRRGLRSEAPLSFAQQRLWFLDQMTPGLAAYNVVNVGRFRGLLDVNALQKALSEIYARHESLRTTFKNVEGSPVQVISEQTQLSFLVEDLSVLSADERESAALRIVCQASQEPFDLERGPLFRVRLLRLGPENHILSVVTHHIVSDGWSLGIFLHELAPLYEAYSEGKPSPLPELPIQFADYAQWQREYLQGPILEKQLSYWREHLGKDLPTLELLTDHPRPSIQTFNGSFTRFHIAEDLTRQIREFCQREKITTYILFMAVYNILLSRYTGQHDILVGSPIAGRNRPETEKLIGLFINTLVLRTRLEGYPSFREVLRRVREASLASYDHQDVPFEKIVEELQPSRDLSRSPVFQAMLILQAPAAPAGFKGIEVTPVDLELTTTKFDLTLFLCEFSEVIEGFVEYNTDLFEGRTMERMLEHFQNLLKAGLQDPEQAIATLPLLSAEERRQVVEEWNRTGMEYDEQASIPDLVGEQALRRPQAVAVRCGEEALSYQELEQRSNRLARRLRKLGVGREQLVGICVERSVRMVVGLLGIMKAGAAYVPLDPSF